MWWWVFWADSHAVSVGVFLEVQQQDMDLFPVHFEKAKKVAKLMERRSGLETRLI